MSDVRNVFRTAADRAQTVDLGTRRAHARAPFTMIEHDPDTAEAFVRRFHDLVVWKHDGNCFNRAMSGVHLLDRMVGLGAGPTDDVFAGAVHVEQELDAKGALTGRFHGSAALRVRGHEHPLDIDFLNDRPLVPFDAEHPPPVTKLIRPYAGTGAPYSDGTVRSDSIGPAFFGGAEEYLGKAWDRATERDVRPDDLEDVVRALHDPSHLRSLQPDGRNMSVRANDAISFE
jgi:hypothetical protein